ncbi:MAG: peptidylprolyl isomerase [Nanoarchaeota archaeon]|nr:peptidylprolyl isomerase [Nanoarchaeota archaeon]
MGKQLVQIDTNKGVIIAEIYEEQVPVTAKNFLDLVRSGFYDGLTFHRYVPGFVIQGGDPDGDGTGGSGTTIPLEIVEGLKHDKGVLAMARSSDPNSASSQFYITLEAAPHLDGSYAIFGRVVQGMDVVENLRQGDVMQRVFIIEK